MANLVETNYAKSAFSHDEHPDQVLVGGIVELDSRGNARKAYDPRFVAGTEPAPGAVLTPHAVTPNVLAEYDTFGRLTAATAQDGSVARIEYHASSILSFDPNDDPVQNRDAPQHYGTPRVARNDGHGRTIVCAARAAS